MDSSIAFKCLPAQLAAQNCLPQSCLMICLGRRACDEGLNIMRQPPTPSSGHALHPCNPVEVSGSTARAASSLLFLVICLQMTPRGLLSGPGGALLGALLIKIAPGRCVSRM